MNREIFFDRPTTLVDIDKLPKGAIFFVDGEPYMRILEMKDKFGASVNCVHLRSGDLEFWDNSEIVGCVCEYFHNYQNIKIVGD